MSKAATKKETTDKDITEKFFKSNKEFHYNYEEFKGDYKVSTGSKIVDEITDGGFSSGLIRFVGPTESGKTAEALEIQGNFLQTVEGSKGIFIKAEGRLSEEMKERTKINFVHDPTEWEIGTTLVVESNVYEFVFDWIRALLQNAGKVRYNIIIDSMDGLIPKDALDKGTADAAKVAAGAVMTSDFLKRVNLAMAKRGHQCIMMGQVRAEIRASQYATKDKNKLGGASGGNAAVHYPDWVIEFLRPNQDDHILPSKDAQISASNKPIGRMAKIKIWKSTNETSMIPISYPIKFGRKNGTSIWVEREIVDLLLAWGFIEKKGSWFNSSDDLTEFLGEEFKKQGLDNIYGALEQDKDLTKKLNSFCDREIFNGV
jgi:RecA/RadA recombinase